MLKLCTIYIFCCTLKNSIFASRTISATVKLSIRIFHKSFTFSKLILVVFCFPKRQQAALACLSFFYKNLIHLKLKSTREQPTLNIFRIGSKRKPAALRFNSRCNFKAILKLQLVILYFASCGMPKRHMFGCFAIVAKLS